MCFISDRAHFSANDENAPVCLMLLLVGKAMMSCGPCVQRGTGTNVLPLAESTGQWLTHRYSLLLYAVPVFNAFILCYASVSVV